MKPQELKNSILQLAIQGKLVEQRPEEGTAEELYRRIQAEKQQLIKEVKNKKGKNKKEEALPEITDDEIPFDIPEGWKWVRLGSIIQLLSGQDMSPENYNEIQCGIPYITGASNINDNVLKINRWTTSAQVLAKCGDILLTCKGTIGKTLILEEEEVHIARQIMAVTPYCVDKTFTAYFLESQLKLLNSQAKSMIPGIGRNDVLSLCFPLPPLAEQKRIVAKIEELLPYIDRYEQAWSKLEEFNKRFPSDMQKSILQTAIQGKLVEQRSEEGTAEELYRRIHAEKQQLIKEGKIKLGKNKKEEVLLEITDDEIPFDIPESWKWVRLSDVVYLTSGNQYDEVFDGIPYIKVADMNMQENQIEITTSSRFSQPNQLGIIPLHSIIFPKRGGAIATNKKRIVIRNPIYIDSNTMGMTVIYEAIFAFLRIWFDSIDLGKLQSGTSVPQINNKDLNPLLFPLPPLAEQKRIVAKIEEILPLCEKLKK